MSGMLDGLRVADLTIVTAGAAATQVLADFGADVIKIEGVTRPDLYRGGMGGDIGDDVAFPPFRTANRNKRAIAVDLKTPDGLEVVRRIVATSDVVAENFRRGVVERAHQLPRPDGELARTGPHHRGRARVSSRRSGALARPLPA